MKKAPSSQETLVYGNLVWGYTFFLSFEEELEKSRFYRSYTIFSLIA